MIGSLVGCGTGIHCIRAAGGARGKRSPLPRRPVALTAVGTPLPSPLLRRPAGRSRGTPTPPSAIFDGLKKAVGGGGGSGSKDFFEAKHIVISQGKGYEIRLYDVHAAVECDYEKRPEAIERLASYMDGKNEEDVQMLPTAPLLMQYDSIQGLQKSMQLFVGPRRGPKQTGTAPLPRDPTLRLVVGGGVPVAVMEFPGNVTPQVAAAARAKLVAALEADGVAVAEADAGGSFQVAQFGAIFQLGGRTNEMRIRISVG